MALRENRSDEYHFFQYQPVSPSILNDSLGAFLDTILDISEFYFDSYFSWH